MDMVNIKFSKPVGRPLLDIKEKVTLSLKRPH